MKSLARTSSGALRLNRTSDGKVSVEVRLDLLPQPTDTYFADAYYGYETNRSCHFVFGKKSVIQSHLTTVLEVVMPLAAVPAILQTFERSRTAKDAERVSKGSFDSELAAFLEKSGNGNAARESIDATRKLVVGTTKEHSVAANFVTMGYTDVDGAIAFYRLPPNVALQAIRSEEDLSKVPINPVVRIDASAIILGWYCEDVRRFAKEAEEQLINAEEPQ